VQIYKLNKTILSFKNNPAEFLNGLTSNTLETPQNAFLNIHGRIIATFDQMRIDDNEFWIAVEKPFIDILMQHMDRYVKLSSVTVEKLSKYIYFDVDNGSSLPPTIDSAIVSPQNQGNLIISDNELEITMSEETFTLFRLKNNIPMQGVDYTDEFVLNVGADNLVSFNKGCFLGQEPVSKVYNRSRPTWQLVVKYENDCDEELKTKMTSKVMDPQVKRMLGFVFIKYK